MKGTKRYLGRVVTLMATILYYAAPVFAAAPVNVALQPTGYVVQPALSSYNLKSGLETSFQATFDKEFWYGDVFAYPVSNTGVVNYAAERWNGAGEHINGQNYLTGRRIVTVNSTTGSKVPFLWAHLSTTQRADLGTVTIGPLVVDYVRGDRSNEDPAGALFRARKSVLGDIIHSRPYLIEGLLYVGANDGMLHVINVNNADATSAGFAAGSEVYAYIPSFLIPKLKNLTVDPYVHTYFIDGPLTYSRFLISGAIKQYLVGTLGAGGRGLFALDISDPYPTGESDAASKILWEVNNNPSASFANLGYTYGLATIMRVRDGAGVTTPAVIVGNGYMDSGTTTRRASLFVIDLTDGSLIKEIVTTVDGSGGPNGLSTPKVVDSNSDGIADYAYAGDLDGTLWKFDLTSDTVASWSATALYTTSPAQAITGAPAVAAHPNGGRMVNFVTGRMLSSADASNSAIHAAYGIWDGAPVGNTGIVTQVLSEATYGTDVRVRVGTVVEPNWGAGGHKGWKTPFPVGGERLVGDGSFISSGRYYFMSTNPLPVRTSPTSSGDNWLLELDYLTGGGAIEPFLDLSGDLVLTSADRLKDGFDVVIAGAPGVPIGKYTGMGITSQPVLAELIVLNTALYNTHPDIVVPLPVDSRGVSGGHFDFDIHYPSSTTSASCVNAVKQLSCATMNGYTLPSGTTETCTYTLKSSKWTTKCVFSKSITSWAPENDTHVHEYDDKYDVTGVNMLNASNASMNLKNVITDTTTTKFKVLVLNSHLSPAATITLGGSSYNKVTSYDNQAVVDSLSNASLLTYTMADIKSLAVNLPVDGFFSKDWGTGVIRPGLVPTQTGCVKGEGSATASGIDSTWRNGALTFQIIKYDTPLANLETNGTNLTQYGYRVKSAKRNDSLIAEYTIFWHHENGFCTDDAGWVVAAPEDLSPATATETTPAAGSDDPKIGSFKDSKTTGDVLSVTTTTVGNVMTTVTVFKDGTTQTTTRTHNADNTYTIHTEYPDGTVDENTTTNLMGGTARNGEETGSAGAGRISWRQRDN